MRPDVILKNFGSSPAVAFIADGRIGMFDDFPASEEVQFNISDKNGVSVVSQDNEFWVPSLFIALSFDEWIVVTQGRKKLVIFGRAHYDDIFGSPTRAHGCIGITRQLADLCRDRFTTM